jgi:hypothetical protein
VIEEKGEKHLRICGDKHNAETNLFRENETKKTTSLADQGQGEPIGTAHFRGGRLPTQSSKGRHYRKNFWLSEALGHTQRILAQNTQALIEENSGPCNHLNGGGMGCRDPQTAKILVWRFISIVLTEKPLALLSVQK